MQIIAFRPALAFSHTHFAMVSATGNTWNDLLGSVQTQQKLTTVIDVENTVRLASLCFLPGFFVPSLSTKLGLSELERQRTQTSVLLYCSHCQMQFQL